MNLPKTMHHWIHRMVLCFCLCIAGSSAKAAESDVPDDGPSLKVILGQARRSVGEFWTQFKSVTCVEKVTQAKLGKEGKPEYIQKSTFDYLVLLNVDDEGFSVEESRLLQGKKNKDKNIPLLITNGIPTLLLVFHPYYQSDFEYQIAGYETADGHRLAKIQFKHIAGTKSTTALRLRGIDYPLDIKGSAWIDPDSGAIHRIIAGLESSRSDHNLKSMEMEVLYDPHKFPAQERAEWLPSSATVDIATERQHWRNVHQFSSYKRFTIDTRDVISTGSAAY